MSYEGDVTFGMRQQFQSCYVSQTSSSGHCMSWIYPNLDYWSKGATPSLLKSDRCDTNSLGWVAEPAWDRFLIPFAGVMWNHGRDALPGETAVMISAGYVPKLYYDNRNTSELEVSAGNDWGYHVNGGKFNGDGADIPPNWPMGLPNSVPGRDAGLTVEDGVSWPMSVIFSISWRLPPIHMVAMSTGTAKQTGTMAAFALGAW